MVLLANSDLQDAKQVAEALQKADYAVMVANDGKTALEMARKWTPALLITDVDLGELSGLELCRILHSDSATDGMQVIVRTDRQSDAERIRGFECGADDYVEKSRTLRELTLRVNAMVRRGRGAKREVVQAGPIAVDHARCCALVDGATIELTPTEFKLLATLAETPNVVQTRDRLLSEVWGSVNAIENRSVDTYLRRLRNKLGQAGQHIKTVYGFGYRIAC
jgi:DNA-binding response OmpR family regulator